jgi:maltooligosyltrehalose trehalohydrolase
MNEHYSSNYPGTKSQFGVWAPDAEKVELIMNQGSLTMTVDKHGWWKTENPPPYGRDYWFLVDSHGPYPDPRSPWQPAGIDGPSRLLDHGRFKWSDHHWQPRPLSAALIYELHVGTFTPEGTFKALALKLDHLLELGVTHIELMPVAQFSGERGWGYDGVNIFAPHHSYGHPHELKELIDICHGRGIAVLLDVVYNHLGPAGNYLPRFGPYFTSHYQTPWGDAVNFDGPHSHEVRRFFIDNALMWLRDYHFDGLRVDAVHAIMDCSAINFLEQLAMEVKQLEAQLGRHLAVIAESDLNDPRIIRPRQAGGYGFDAQWNEDFHHALHAALTGEKQGYYADFGGLFPLAEVMQNNFVYDGCYSVYRRRMHGRDARDLSGHQLVGCLQNHDQVGNRALGERTSRLLSTDQLKIGAALVFASPFIPMLFQGEEWGASTPFLYFTAHDDPELAREVRKGRRNEFSAFDWPVDDIPDPQDTAAFERSKLKWEELRLESHQEILSWHKDLIRLRRLHPSLSDGRSDKIKVYFDNDNKWLIIYRGTLSLVFNLSSRTQTINYPQPQTKGNILLASHEDEELVARIHEIKMPAYSVAVID